MKRSLKWRLALGILMVFFAGLGTGLFAGAWHARHVIVLGHSAQLAGRMREHFRRELRLTPEQFAKIGPIIDRMAQRLQTIRTDTGRHVAGTMTQARDEMIPLLTAEQRVRLQKMEQRHRRAIEAHGFHPPEEPHIP